jgi:hypothetical protein
VALESGRPLAGRQAGLVGRAWYHRQAPGHGGSAINPTPVAPSTGIAVMDGKAEFCPLVMNEKVEI